MKNLFFCSLLILLTSFSTSAQENEATEETKRGSQKGNWFFGAEIGINKIDSYEFGEDAGSFQGGILAEYYFARQWSFSARLKYFETGISFGTGDYYSKFSGNVISLPLNFTWEFGIWNGLKGNLSSGFAFNKELKSDYDYPESRGTGYSKQYYNFNFGFGLTYFISPRSAVYVKVENFSGGKKGNSLILSKYLKNNFINLGVKFNSSDFQQ